MPGAGLASDLSLRQLKPPAPSPGCHSAKAANVSVRVVSCPRA